ncbi:unnamed protein product [Moneuplotes crassus]|uniref:Uncharacterized protein n=1 Tax=Euplotes crassus TaxID=5936 RepID=A0AAD1XMT0_EUPCR|nr:unnamed protein product [Moneuplotes crassus]
MKLLVTILLATLLVSSSANGVTEAEDFLRGLLNGSFRDVGHEVVECIQDGEEIFKDLIVIAEDFEKAAAHWNKDALVDAFKHISHILTLMPEELKDCKGVAELAKDLSKLAAEFANPITLVIDIGEKMVWHGRSIYKDVKKASEDFKVPDYEAAGYDIGDIIRIIFLNGMIKSPFSDVSLFITEFYSAAFSIDMDLNTCEANVEKSVLEIYSGIEILVNYITLDDVSRGIVKIVYGVMNFIQDSQKCEEVWPSIQEGLEEMMPFINNFQYLIYAVPTAFIFNPITFYQDVSNIMAAFDHYPQDFKLAGYSSGDLVKLILKHM